MADLQRPRAVGSVDIIHAALMDVAARSLAGPAVCTGAGLVGSLGPCAAPRMVAVAGIGSDRVPVSLRCRSMASLIAGICCGYVILGLAATVLFRMMQMVGILYAAMCIVLLFVGIKSIVASDGVISGTGCRHERGMSGASFFAGISFALVVSPCCTPIVAGIAAFAQANGDWPYSGLCMACFALGHSAPLAIVGFASMALRERILRYAPAVGVINGALLLGLAGYYAVLA